MILRRLLVVVLIPIWLLTIMTVIIPVAYWVITGKNYLDTIDPFMRKL